MKNRSTSFNYKYPPAKSGWRGFWLSLLLCLGTTLSAQDIQITVHHIDPSGSGLGAIDIDIQEGIAPFNITCTNTLGQIVIYEGTVESWEIGDGPEITIDNLAAGTYELEIVDNNNCLATELITVMECDGEELSALFDAEINGLAVTFNDESTACSPILIWQWNFDDGSAPSFEQMPVHIYEEQGEYTVVLTITNEEGITDSYETDIVIDASELTVFIAGPEVGSIGQSIQLNAYASGGAGGPYDYQWQFGFGSSPTISTDPSPSVAYSTGGAKNISLTVTDIGGATQTVNHLIVVNNTSMFVDFSFSEGGLNLMYFSSNVEGAIGDLSYSWDFDDGTGGLNFSSLAAPAHNFSGEGVYNVELEVCDDNGCVTVTKPVPVGNPLFVDFTSSPCGPCEFGPNEEIEVTFDPIVSGGTPPYEYFWTFENFSGASYEENPTEFFAQPFCYDVFLRVTDHHGRMATIMKDCYIEGPVPDFQVTGIAIRNNCYQSVPWLEVNAVGGNIDNTPNDATYGPCAGDPVRKYFSYQWSINGSNGAFLSFNDQEPCAYLDMNYHLFDPLDEGEAVSFICQIVVTDLSGLTVTYQNFITIYPPMSVETNHITACPGQQVQLGGFPVAEGGHSPYLYSWTFEGSAPPIGTEPGQLSCTNCPNPLTTVPEDGESIIFGLRVEDTRPILGACVLNENIKLTGASLIAEAGGGPDAYITTCIGPSTTTLGPDNPADAASGGSGQYTYQWTPIGNLSNANIPNPVVVASSEEPITYQLMITDQYGCMAYDEITVSASFSEPVAHAGDDQYVCFDSNPVLGGTPAASGTFNGNTIFQWSSADSDFTSSEPNPTLPNQTNSGYLSYQLEVIDAANGCISTDEVTLQVQMEWQYEGMIPGLTEIVCQQDAEFYDVFSSSLNEITGPFNTSLPELEPQPPFEYTWTEPQALGNPNQNGLTPMQTFRPDDQVSFVELIVTDQLGCQKVFPSKIVLTDADKPAFVDMSVSSVANPCDPDADPNLCVNLWVDRNFNRNNDDFSKLALPMDIDFLQATWASSHLNIDAYYDPNRQLYYARYCTISYPGLNSILFGAANSCGETQTTFDYYFGFPGDFDNPNIVCEPSSLPTGAYTGSIVRSGGICEVDVNPNRTVHFIAGQYVHLEKGFTAHPGSEFFAYIGEETCSEFQEEEAAEDRVEESDPVIPLVNSFSLFPNPFSSDISISYRLEAAVKSKLTLSLLDISGKRLATLLEESNVAKGEYTYTYDGQSLAPGTYFFELNVDGKKYTERVAKIQ